MTNWKELIQKNEESLAEAIRKQFKAACGSPNYLEYSVLLYHDGRISLIQEQKGNTDYNAYQGHAIYIDTTEGWNPEIDWKVGFEKGGLFEEQTQEVLKKYNELNDADCTSIDQLDEMESFLQEHFPKIYQEAVDAELDWQVDELDTDAIIQRKIDEMTYDE